MVKGWNAPEPLGDNHLVIQHLVAGWIDKPLLLDLKFQAYRW